MPRKLFPQPQPNMHTTSNNTKTAGDGVKYSTAPQDDVNANGDIDNKLQHQTVSAAGTINSKMPPATVGSNPSTKPKDVTVLFKGEHSSYSRRQNGLVKYLMAVCMLLFLTCVIFIVIAFLPRNPSKSGKKTNMCCYAANCVNYNKNILT